MEKINSVKRLNNALLEEASIPLQKAGSSVLNLKSQSDFKKGLEEKLLESKRYIRKISEKVHISLVVPVYGEKNRVTDRSDSFVHQKLSQLRSLLSLNRNISWDLAFVDDGCPVKSGEWCLRILKRDFPELYLSRQVKVFFLKDGLEGHGLGVMKGLRSTRSSKKGGAVLFGLMCEMKEVNLPKDKHLLVYTDADLSVHLGQLGLLLNPLINGPFDVAAGSRREKDSVVRRSSKRAHRGKLFIYFWKRVLPQLRGIFDTQAPFKAFSRPVLEKILNQTSEYGFSFDIELLLMSEMEGFQIAKVPIAFEDESFKSSTVKNNVHLKMLKSIVSLGERFGGAAENKFLHFLRNLDEDRWSRILEKSGELLSLYDLHELEDNFVGDRIFEIIKSL